MGSISTDSNSSGILGAFHDRRLLERFENNTVFYPLGDKRPLATKDGKTATFHYFDVMGRGALVSEATQPANSFMTTATRTATIVQFGQVLELSDLLYKTAITDMLVEAADQFGDSSSRTLDEYIQDRLYSDETTFSSSSGHEGPYGYFVKETHALSSFYKGVHGGLSTYFLSTTSAGVSALSTVSNGFLTTVSTVAESMGARIGDLAMTLQKIRYIVTKLETSNVPTFDGSTYVMAASPAVISQLREDSEWREWNRYQHAAKMFNNEIGMVENVRVLKATNCLSTTYQVSSGRTIHLASILGKQAFCITELEGDGGIKMKQVPFTAPSLDNVLQQRAAIGWIYTGCAKVLQPEAGYGILVPMIS